MKLPNGFGSVTKLSGKRRNPYMVRITSGYTDDGKEIRNVLGYFPTKSAALEALAVYNTDPYDLSSKDLTFSQVYDEWSKEYLPTLANDSSRRTITAAYKHCTPLYNLPFKSIKVMHLEQAIDSADVGLNTKARMKSMFNLIYRFAIKHEICDKDYAALCKSVKVRESEHHEAFTPDQIAALETLEHPFVDMVIIGIYSGWRPTELVLLKMQDIDLDNLTMRGGIKTQAGTNRIVPIHHKIIPLITKRYEYAKKINSDLLFVDENDLPLTYDKYRGRFAKVLNKLKYSNLSPHSTRTTFITLAKKYGADEYILKRIVGHEIDDITERVYTKRDIEQLRAEIEKIP